MTAALVATLAAASTACPELDAWCRCDEGRDERCETCALGGPDRCESAVIKALARILADVLKI